MGAAELAFWTSLDSFVCDHRHLIWHRFLQSSDQANLTNDRSAFRAQSHFQLRFHSPAIWTKK
jgi:hypothetical protein